MCDKAVKTWFGSTPTVCDICHEPFDKVFYDAKVRFGGWARTCVKCFKEHTHGRLGTGFGQEYTLSENGQWRKTGG